ncbi:hypothetical protein TNCV_3713621 [Trichonephila clavipes]|nr:hypothetical protein TNCV_3713621 [Trichonephila clavipes]
MWKRVSGSFGEGLFYQLESISWCIVIQREVTNLHFTRTEAVYDKWIPTNDVLEKYVASGVCESVWRRSIRTLLDTNATFSVILDVEYRPTRSLSQMDSRLSLICR